MHNDGVPLTIERCEAAMRVAPDELTLARLYAIWLQLKEKVQ